MKKKHQKNKELGISDEKGLDLLIEMDKTISNIQDIIRELKSTDSPIQLEFINSVLNDTKKLIEMVTKRKCND